MSIIIYLGNIGSGKTAYAVREMFKRPYRTYYSNIVTRKIKNSILLKPEMIFSKRPDPKNPKHTEQILNIDFWKSCKKPISVIFDEAHNILNSRKGMNRQNILIGEFLSLLRRVLGGDTASDLILISQLSRRLDIIAREMSTKVYFFVSHFKKVCKKCGYIWRENSEMPEQASECPFCNHYDIKKFSHILEVKVFSSVDNFDLWKEEGIKTYYRQFIVNDIENVFNKYDTLQWENMFSQEYE